MPDKKVSKDELDRAALRIVSRRVMRMFWFPSARSELRRIERMRSEIGDYSEEIRPHLLSWLRRFEDSARYSIEMDEEDAQAGALADRFDR